MLLALSLRDFVIVDQLDLDFQNGFTVLTGETGAGKSITLDAIGLLLGDKADYSQIRTGASEAKLSALFNISALPELHKNLVDQGFIDEETDEISIRRIIDIKGKSRNYINNQAATLAQLKQLGEQLIDIHGQNAHQSLNKEHTQRSLLDAFANTTDLAHTVKQQYRHLQQAKQALNDAKTQAETLQIEQERLLWQQNELQQLGMGDHEWQSLNESHDTLAHAADLLEAAETVSNFINDDNGLQSRVYQCQKTLESLTNIEPKFAESMDMLYAIEAELSEIAANMSDVVAKTDINPAELQAQEDRIAEIMSMARKYRIDPEQLPAKLTEIDAALDNLQASTDIDSLQQVVDEAEKQYRQTAEQLSHQRTQAAKRLSEETTQHMQELAMKGAQFSITLTPSEPGPNGLEHIQYLVASNQGSPLRPMAKVASGGELARISLALQVVTSHYTRLPTLIFDEVDTGIGGGVAETVGKALRTLGQHHQVLAITHLPQVASCGEHHWQVSKHTENGQTLSHINILDNNGRIEEIARMLGGETITETTRKHAAEMLNQSA